MPERPNLLFIFTDQQRADTMACYGNRMIETPNLNRLSDESFVFENAYVSAPICSPSRSTIMTGLWPHTSGVLKNNFPLDDSTPVISEMLPPDYISGYYGKWHLGNEVKRQHGFDRWVSIEDQYRDYYQESDYGSTYSDHFHHLVEHGYEPDRDFEGAKVFSRPFAAKVKEEHTKAMFLADRASEFIHTYRQRPWALYINIFEPHPPYTGPFDDMYDPASIPVPPTFLKPPPDNAALMHTLIQRHADEEELPASEWNEEGWRRLIARYWGLVTLVDRAVGRILAALEESGTADNTVVVFTSEHGDQLGEHSIFQKAVFYEQSVKVPLLMRVPWLGREQQMVPGRWSHIDLVPTLLDLIGSAIPDHLQGSSRAPVLAGEETMDGVDAVIDWNGRDRARHGLGLEVDRVQNIPHRGLIGSDGWKINLSVGDRCELYDLNTDPYEQANVFDDPANRERSARHGSGLRTWQRQTGDTAPLPDV